MTDAIKDTFDNFTKTITECSFSYNKAIGNLNERILEMMIYKGLMAHI